MEQQQQQRQREERIDWQTMGADACRHAGLQFDSMDVLVRWTEEYCANAIYQLDGSAYLKLFGPTAANQYHVERAMLELLAGREDNLYLNRTNGSWSVSGIIDWADAMRGPEEWDIAFIWFWMFSRDREAMHRFLAARYGQDGPPDGLARRCLGAILQMFEWDVFWSEIVERCTGLEADPVGAATTLLFPQDVFWPGRDVVREKMSEQ